MKPATFNIGFFLAKSPTGVYRKLQQIKQSSKINRMVNVFCVWFYAHLYEETVDRSI